MFDVSAWFQDAFCSNVFCTDAQSILCEDAFNPDKPPEEGQVTDRERQLRALGIAGAALDRPDPHTGNTALLIAAAENAVGAPRDAPLNQLVEFGADLLAKNKKGQTPLLVAAGKGHADAFRALAWCLERDGKLAEAAILTVTEDARRARRAATAPAALLDHGAKLEATNAQGHTALHTAAEHGRAPVLEELLARGARGRRRPGRRAPRAPACAANDGARCRALLDTAHNRRARGAHAKRRTSPKRMRPSKTSAARRSRH
ncbi:spectrin binding protein [Aureococcus anophagefferens]|uniref:Spectrin binding protein n=1 Tax=Aureococcus anophagefferens TaxID=44056 RepID=A0ABR1G1G0_AURAN